MSTYHPPCRLIGFFAPADNFDKNKFHTAYYRITKKFHNLEYLIPRNIFKRYGTFAGTDTEKLEDINYLIKKKVNMIIGIKGGYGSARLLGRLDYKAIKNNRIFFMGYSDLTSILIAVNQMTGNIAYYGFLAIADFSDKLYNRQIEIFNEVINNRMPEYSLSCRVFKRTEGVESFSGISIAGCLSIICSLVGTRYFNQYKKPNILFLEDINEEPYRIERMLMHLKNAGVFKKTKCLFLDFNKCNSSKKNRNTISLKKSINDIFYEYDFPVIEFKHFGHRKNKILIPIGSECKASLQISKNANHGLAQLKWE